MVDIDEAEILDMPQAEFEKLIELAKQLKALTQEGSNASTSLIEPQQAA